MTQIISFNRNGKRYDIVKAWTPEAREASAEARRKIQVAISRMPKSQYQDFLAHLKAGTPKRFAYALAERQPGRRNNA